MSLFSKGPHSHYGGEVKRESVPVTQFAELSAYIRETLKTAVDSIEYLKDTVVQSVTATVKGHISILERTVAGLQGEADSIMEELVRDRDIIIDSSADTIRKEVDGILESLTADAKIDIEEQFAEVRDEYVNGVKTEAVQGVKDEIEGYVDSALQSVGDNLEVKSGEAVAAIGNAKDLALVDLANRQLLAVESVNSAGTGKIEEIANAITNSKDNALGEINDSVEVFRDIKNDAIEELENKRDEILDGSAVAGHQYATGAVWKTGDTIRIPINQTTGQMATFDLYKRVYMGFVTKVGENNFGQVFLGLPQASGIIDYKFYNIKGDNCTDLIMSSDKASVMIPFNQNTTREYFFEILYINT